MHPDPLFETRARLFEAIKQRDSALDLCLDKTAQLALAGRRIGELEAEVSALTEQLDTLKQQETS